MTLVTPLVQSQPGRMGYIDSAGRWLVRSESELRAALVGDVRGRVVMLGGDFSIGRPITIARARTVIDGAGHRIIPKAGVTKVFNVVAEEVTLLNVTVGTATPGSQTAVTLLPDAHRLRVHGCRFRCATAVSGSANDTRISDTLIQTTLNGVRSEVSTHHGGASFTDTGSNQAVTSGVWTAITNDANSSDETFAPVGHSGLWDDSAGAFDLSSLQAGDVVDIDVGFETQAAAGQIEARLDHATAADHDILVGFQSANGVVRARWLVTIPDAAFAAGALTPKVKLGASVNVQALDFRIEVRRLGM